MGAQIPLGSAAPLLRVTAEQLEAMAARGALAGLPRIELRDGVLCQMNPQYRPHLLAKSAIYDALRDELRAAGSALGVASEGSVRIGEREVPMPDVFVWDVHRGAGPVPVEHVQLVVEVSDTTLEDDLGRKRQVYAAGGIPEYWVVDLSGQIVRQYWAPADGSYARETVVRFGERLSAATLPHLGIDTTALRDEG
ncbi:MAG TPA: Uma2 family endonuclease [Acetobacteraceae bacterium]